MPQKLITLNKVRCHEVALSIRVFKTATCNGEMPTKMLRLFNSSRQQQISTLQQMWDATNYCFSKMIGQNHPCKIEQWWIEQLLGGDQQNWEQFTLNQKSWNERKGENRSRMYDATMTTISKIGLSPWAKGKLKMNPFQKVKILKKWIFRNSRELFPVEKHRSNSTYTNLIRGTM